MTFGLGPRESADRVVAEWPRGSTVDFKNVRSGAYKLIEGGRLLPPR